MIPGRVRCRHPGGDRPVLGDGRRSPRPIATTSWSSVRSRIRSSYAIPTPGRPSSAPSARALTRTTASCTSHTISWLPQTLEVRVWSPLPEPGVNLDLYQTLDAVSCPRRARHAVGPVRDHAGSSTSDRSRSTTSSRAAVVQYRAISTASNLLISDCIHAVAAVDPVFGRGHYPLIRIGDPASRFLAREIVVRSVENRGIDQAAYDNSWLIPRPGSDRHAIGVVLPAADPAPPLPAVCRRPEIAG